MSTTVAVSTHPWTDPEVDALQREARRLWDDEPILAAADREAMLVELARLGAELERLALRARWSGLTDDDRRSIATHAERLSRLSRRWEDERQSMPVAA